MLRKKAAERKITAAARNGTCRQSIVAGKKQLFSTNISVSPEEFSQLENQKKAAAVQILYNQQEREKIKRQKRLLDERETEIVEKEKSYSVRKSELDEREKNIEKSKKRTEDILSEAERKMRATVDKYNSQLDLNKRYNSLECELRKARNEGDENAGILSEIRLAAGIPVTDNKTDIAEKCKEITEENREIKNELRKELNLTAEKADEIPATELLHGVLEKPREIEKENEKNKSVIMSLTEKFSRIKAEFIKVVLALNSLIYDKKYNRGLTGISQILAESISLFADDCFKKRGEYDDIDRSHIDGEIMENMRALTENKQEKNTNYYER